MSVTAIGRMRSRLAFAAVLLPALSLAPGVITSAQAAKVYRWTDRNGVAHYGDHVPNDLDPQQTPVVRIPVPAEPETIARLRFETRDNGVEAWAENTLGGPIEVLLRREHGKGASTPSLPARAVVPAQTRTLVSLLAPDADGELRLDVVPGDPDALPRDVEYLYPLQTSDLRIEQGYGGDYSHQDAQNRHAVDFAAEIGTPVLAARAGTVMQVEGDFDKAGLNAEKYAGRANFVRIVHDDGTMAVYAHLKADGVLVRVGQRVRKAQVIGLSGNTGYTTGPHLHFVVQVNRGMSLESIPFRMFGPQGILRFTEAK